MSRSYRIHAFYPNYFSDAAIARVALRILGYFNDNQIRASVMGLCSDATLSRYKRVPCDYGMSEGRISSSFPVYQDAILPEVSWAVLRRVLNYEKLLSVAERRFLSEVRKGDIVYLWPGASERLYRQSKSRGCIVVSERINTLLCNSKRILDMEYHKLGMLVSHEITEDAIAEELRCMEHSDFIYSPSPMVTKSILEAGMPEEKILQTSYGLDEQEILKKPIERPAGRRITALFAGSICVRKGIHLLLKAWKHADVDARLVVVGRITPEMDSLFRSEMKDNPDIEYREHVKDLEPLYRDADFFILPSLEEGSPLVSYLALGAGLPLIVSNMGGGGVVKDHREGLIIDPHDEDGFATAIRSMVMSADMRREMAHASSEQAKQYTWDVVAKKRLNLLLERL